MEIRNNPKLDPRRDATGEVAPAKGRSGPNESAAKSGASAAAGDRVTLTEAAQRLLQGADAGAPVDKSKVETIRKAIADGTYTVDAQRVAAKLIELDNPSES